MLHSAMAGRKSCYAAQCYGWEEIMLCCTVLWLGGNHAMLHSAMAGRISSYAAQCYGWEEIMLCCTVLWLGGNHAMLHSAMAGRTELARPPINGSELTLAGKTTVLREYARLLSLNTRLNVIVVDKTCELAGDSATPHPAIGSARWM
jgi:hypothetical protein